MSQSSQINIRSWLYAGQKAFEDMILGMDECVILDTNNVASSDKIHEYEAIVDCQMGGNIFTHTAQIARCYKGDDADVWDRSRGAGSPPGCKYE